MLRNSRIQLWFESLIVIIAFTLGWKLIFYIIWPYSYCDDSYSYIRFLSLVIFIVATGKKKQPVNVRANWVQFFAMFFAYGIILYGFDLIIHFVIDPRLKFSYLSERYTRWYSDARTNEEVKNHGRLATIDESVTAAILREFSIRAILKRFFIQIGVYLVFTAALVIYFNKYRIETKKD